MDGGAIVFPQILASQQIEPVQVLVDHTSIYWLDWSEPGVGSLGAIMKASKIGGGCPQVLASGLRHPNSIALSSHWVYWADDDAGTIERIATDGSMRQVVAVGQLEPYLPQAFNGSLYWIDNGPPTGRDHLDGTIVTVAENGGAPSVLVSGMTNPRYLAVDATGLYWTLFGGYPIPDTCCPGGLFKAPLSGGPSTSLAIANISTMLVLTATSVFWASDLGICEVSKQGGAFTVLAPYPVFYLAMDMARLFWDWPGDPNKLFDNGWIREQDLDGGAVQYVASPVTFPASIAVDDSFVYWIESGDPENGFVMRAPK